MLKIAGSRPATEVDASPSSLIRPEFTAPSTSRHGALQACICPANSNADQGFGAGIRAVHIAQSQLQTTVDCSRFRSTPGSGTLGVRRANARRPLVRCSNEDLGRCFDGCRFSSEVLTKSGRDRIAVQTNPVSANRKLSGNCGRQPVPGSFHLPF